MSARTARSLLLRRLVAVAAGVTLGGCTVLDRQDLGQATIEDIDPGVPFDAFRVEVRWVTDGDTIQAKVLSVPDSSLEQGDDISLRLLRIDTPETSKEGQVGECLADQATEALLALAPRGSTLWARHDVEHIDRFGRDLVHLWTTDGIWINGALVDQGMARVVLFEPNDGYEVQIRAREAAAKDAGVGIWGLC